MRFADELTGGRCPVALEITPPQRSLPAVLLRRARLLGPRACAINVIQRPDRQSSLEASIELLGSGIEPAWHLVTHGRSRDALEADLRSARAAGVHQILCLRGDHEVEQTVASPSIREAIAMARDLLPHALVGATLNQHAREPGRALANLLPKLAAGATYVQTQPVFDLAPLRGFVERVRDRAPRTHLVAMVMPLLSETAARRIQARLGFELPASLLARIAASVPDAWELFDEILHELVGSGLADALAVMTFEVDPSPEVAARIVASLDRAIAGKAAR